MPVACLANASIVHGRSSLDELEDFAGGRARSEHGSYPHSMECRAVIVGNDAPAEDDDVVETGFSKFVTDLREEVGVGA